MPRPSTIYATSWMLVLCACGSNPKQANHSGDLVPTVSLDSDVSIETGTPTDSADTAPIPPVDNDGDGYSAEEDCDDADPSRYPGAPERCDDGVVSDCTLSEDQALDLCRVVSPDRAVLEWNLASSERDPVRGRPIGDTNGNGKLEVAFGSTRSHGGDYASGGIVIYDDLWSGGWHEEPDPTVVPGIAEWDAIGTDILPIGDVNADGFDDIVVGASDDPYNPSSGTPALYVLLGPIESDAFNHATALVDNPYNNECLGSVLTSIPTLGDPAPPIVAASGQCRATVRLFETGVSGPLSPTGDAIAVLQGPAPDRTSGFGHSLASADFDGDGFSDLAVGAPEYIQSAPRNGLGFVSVFNGPVVGDLTYNDAHATLTAHAADSAPYGESGVQVLFFGSGLASDDFDGDGYADLAVGAPVQNAVVSDFLEGAVHIFPGPLSGAIDLGSATLSILGDGQNDGLGGSIEAGSDVDGDGSNDLLVGNAYLEITGTAFSTWGSAAKRTWLFHGPLPTGTMDAADFDAAYEWPDVPLFGAQVTSVGDLDGDGTHEVLVGTLGNHFLLFTQPGF